MNAAADFVIVIPCRYQSERLPGKALLDIHGKTLVQRVWERAVASSARQVVIATDDRRIASAAEAFGAQAVMTSANHSCGSDRIAECAVQMGWDSARLIVNLQGDEPLMPPQCLDQVARLLTADEAADAATLYWPMDRVAEVKDTNAVKVVVSQEGSALFFSREVIPHPRGYPSLKAAMAAGGRWNRHLGLYAYRNEALQRFARTAPAPLERLERLEQLRILESGGRIAIARACREIPAGVDTGADLERVRALISSEI